MIVLIAEEKKGGGDYFPVLKTSGVAAHVGRHNGYAGCLVSRIAGFPLAIE